MPNILVMPFGRRCLVADCTVKDQFILLDWDSTDLSESKKKKEKEKSEPHWSLKHCVKVVLNEGRILPALSFFHKLCICFPLLFLFFKMSVNTDFFFLS